MNQAWWGEKANGSRSRWPIVAAVIVVAAVIAIGWVATRGHGDGGYRVVMRPTAPLSASACRTERRKLRMVVAGDPCTAASGQPWFRITVRNVSDGNGFPVCRATAYDRSGQSLFDQDVPIGLIGGEPSGPQVARGTSIHLTWYFDPRSQDRSYVQHTRWTPHQVTRYTVACHGRSQSQVPI